jgi:hypothetical protein
MSTYAPLPGLSTSPCHSDAHAIRLDDSPPPARRSLDSDSDESDIIYRDALDVEPFDEKDLRFKDEGPMEDGVGGGADGQGHTYETRRVSVAMSTGLICYEGIMGLPPS